MAFAMVLVGFLSVIAFTDWKRGIYLCVITAFVQDPVRKLLPEQPALCILFAAFVFAAATVGAISANSRIGLSHIPNWSRYLETPFWAFVVIVVLQTGNSLVRFANPLVSALGLMNYFLPILALVTSYCFFSKSGLSGTLRLFTTYVLCSAIALFTVYLESVGAEWQVLGEVGEGVKMHFFDGLAKGRAGTFRASEIAAWHAGMTACVLIVTLSVRKIDTARMILLAVTAPACVGIGLLTGRRKLVMLILIFVVSYVGMQVILLKRTRITALVVSLVALVFYSGQVSYVNEEVDDPLRASEYERYVRRNKTVFAEVPERFVGFGLTPIMWAQGWFGPFGGGVGIGTQGVQKIANLGDHVGAAEGGLGRIALELGLPGLAVAIFGVISLGRHIWNILLIAQQHSKVLTRLACGLASLLIANLASFTVATQAYGDAFVMLFLGMILAALLAVPDFIARSIEVGSVIQISESSVPQP